MENEPTEFGLREEGLDRSASIEGESRVAILECATENQKDIISNNIKQDIQELENIRNLIELQLEKQEPIISQIAPELKEKPAKSKSSKRDKPKLNLKSLESQISQEVEVPQVDRETGIYTDENGCQWASLSIIAELFNFSYAKIEKLKLTALNHLGRDRIGRDAVLFSLDEAHKQLEGYSSLPQVDKDTGIYTDESGREWAPIGIIAKIFGVSDVKIESFSLSFLSGGRSRSGKTVELFSLDEAREQLAEFFELPQVDKDTGIYTDESGREWATERVILQLLDFDIRRIRSPKLTSREGRNRINVKMLLFSLDEAREQLIKRNSALQVDKDTGIYVDATGNQWAQLKVIAKLFGVAHSKIRSLELKTLSHTVKGRSGHSAFLLSVDQAREQLAEFLDFHTVDSVTGIYTETTGRQWAQTGVIADILGVSDRKVESLKLTIFPGRTGVIDRNGKIATLYSLDEAREQLVDYIETKDRQIELDGLEQLLRSEIEKITNPETLESEEFQALVNLFGAHNAADLLYLYRPEFKGLSVDYVKKVIAEYLGDFMLEKRGFSADDLEIASIFSLEGHRNIEGLRDHFTYVLKRECLKELNDWLTVWFYETSQIPERSELQIIVQEHLDRTREHLQTGALEKILGSAFEETAEYYQSLFSIEKPERIIQSLVPNRLFPDINQLVNIKELKDQHRLLIADEMGLGKSASVILAKESLGLQRALVVVPSNVISTWRTYLSDHANGKGKGYFEPGQAPSVFVVENPQDLVSTDLSLYEYVLISQERLSDGNVKRLLSETWDMLIVDEVHKMKNVTKGKRSANLLSLAEQIQGNDKYLAILSGTPVPNKVNDIAVSLKLLYPDEFSEIPSEQLVASILGGDLVSLRSKLLPRMQKKMLAESLQMPELTQHYLETELSTFERDIYLELLDEDEVTASVKLQTLRKFLMNPSSIGLMPEVVGSKVSAVRNELKTVFTTKDKVILFVNDYIDGVVRGENTIIEQFQLAGVQVQIVDGKNTSERQLIQNEFNTSDGKMLLVVSGQTADVGVDYSAAEHVIFYNEPWSKYILKQQLGRAYRAGLTHPLSVSTYVTKDTLEEGIHKYIAIKERAVEKLLTGIPLSEVEKHYLRQQENQHNPILEVNPQVAEQYYHSFKQMLKDFSTGKRLGEKPFLQFLERDGERYANGYENMGARSLQANANRVSGAVIQEIIQKNGMNIESVSILDAASGPEMLRRHINDGYKDRVHSIDINPLHFRNSPDGQYHAASFTDTKMASSSLDVVHLGMAYHYTAEPHRGNTERFGVFAEMNRVLKLGGYAVMNNLHSHPFKNPELLEELLEQLGFEVVRDYSGLAQLGTQYRSELLVLRKTKESILTFEQIADQMPNYRKALKFSKRKIDLSDQKKILTKFELNGRELPVSLNEQDRITLGEEEDILKTGGRLKEKHDGIEKIPRNEVVENGFARYYTGKQWVLFRKLRTALGAVVVK